MFLNQDNQKDAKEFFTDVIDVGMLFKNDKKVHKKSLSIEDGKKMIEVMPTEGKDIKMILAEFKETILPYCTNFWSAKFMGFPDAGNSIAGIWGALLSDFLQQNLINQSFCSPSATFTEINVIRRLREIVGYENGELNDIDDVWGVITWGGTTSNSIAILLWRENKYPWTIENGVYDLPVSYVVVPKWIGHYSVKSAQMQIGLGHHLLEVETEDFRYNLKELEKTLNEYKWKISTLVAYVGDSRTMTVDNLEEIYDLCKRIDPSIRLHADSCHGFSLWCSQSLKHKIKWIEKFDSITTDPHKVFNLPYVISALLIKDPKQIKKIISISDLITQEAFSFGQITPFIWSKSRLSLKLWFFIKNLWKKWLDQLITRRHDIAVYLSETLKKNSNFVVLNDVEINSVIFMFTGGNIKEIERLNEINKKIYEIVLQEWEYYIHKFSIPDRWVFKKGETLYPLRFMSGNPNVQENDIHDLVSYIGTIGERVIKSM